MVCTHCGALIRDSLFPPAPKYRKTYPCIWQSIIGLTEKWRDIHFRAPTSILLPPRRKWGIKQTDGDFHFCSVPRLCLMKREKICHWILATLEHFWVLWSGLESNTIFTDQTWAYCMCWACLSCAKYLRCHGRTLELRDKWWFNENITGLIPGVMSWWLWRLKTYSRSRLCKNIKDSQKVLGKVPYQNSRYKNISL